MLLNGQRTEVEVNWEDPIKDLQAKIDAIQASMSSQSTGTQNAAAPTCSDCEYKIFGWRFSLACCWWFWWCLALTIALIGTILFFWRRTRRLRKDFDELREKLDALTSS